MQFLGRLDSKYGVGTNNLIKRGAKLVTNIKDILEDFDEFDKREKRKKFHNSVIKKEYRKIYEILSDIPMSVDEISDKTKNDIVCSLRLLTLMEIEDVIEQKLGGYVRKKLKE